jgi:hypothetical protein
VRAACDTAGEESDARGFSEQKVQKLSVKMGNIGYRYNIFANSRLLKVLKTMSRVIIALVRKSNNCIRRAETVFELHKGPINNYHMSQNNVMQF